ncbi:MAG TPA: sigma-70 family RNA polymerase sigma factor, partial [Steroidobacteraceae bacterium]|nr:sigma-70 family RNA polymerase sigma factor [Steroidobacteraceae bacterium]
QEAFLTAFADLHRYEPTGRFAAWLTRLTYQQARAQRTGMRFAGPAALPPRPEPAPADAGEQAQLEAAIAALPEVFRTVFVMRFVEGVSGIETAASLGVHETTVRTRLYRAQKRLGAPAVQRVRATAVLELAPERLEQLAQRIRAQLPRPVAPAAP